MNNNYPILSTEYPKLDFSDLKEKNIIYFLRTQFGHYTSQNTPRKKLDAIQMEIITLLKSKEWNYQAVDIDNCTFLTYSLYNNVNDVVDFLLNEKKYDLTISNKINISSTESVITLSGHDNLLKILSIPDLHEDYLNHLFVKCFAFLTLTSKKEYQDMLDLFDFKKINYSKSLHILHKQIQNEERNLFILEKFLTLDYKIDIKIQAIENILEKSKISDKKIKNNTLQSAYKEINKKNNILELSLEKMRLYQNLEINIPKQDTSLQIKKI